MSTGEDIFFYFAVALASGITFYIHCIKAEKDSIASQWRTWMLALVVAVSFSVAATILDLLFVGAIFKGLALGAALGTFVGAPICTGSIILRLGVRKTMADFARTAVRYIADALVFVSIVAVWIFFIIFLTDRAKDEVMWGVIIFFGCMALIGGILVTILFDDWLCRPKLSWPRKKAYGHH